MDIAGSPVVHVVLVLDLVGEHVETVSVLASTGVVVSAVGFNTLDPARSVSEWSVDARKDDFTLGSDAVGVNFFQGHFDVAGVVVVCEWSNVLAVSNERLLPSVGVSAMVRVGGSIIEVLVEEVLGFDTVLEELDFEHTKLVTAVGISGLVCTDSSKHDKLLHGSVVLPGQISFFDFILFVPAVAIASGVGLGSGVINTVSVEVDGIDAGQRQQSKEGSEFHWSEDLSIKY